MNILYLFIRDDVTEMITERIDGHKHNVKDFNLLTDDM